MVQGEADVNFAFHDEHDLVDLFVFAENLSVWQILQCLQSLHDFDHEGAVVALILTPPVVRMPHLMSVFGELEKLDELMEEFRIQKLAVDLVDCLLRELLQDIVVLLL